MNMKRSRNLDFDVTEVILSERNVRSLVAKLDGHPPDSALELRKVIDGTDELLIVRVERDGDHYGARPYGPGPMHPDTERALALAGEQRRL